MISKMINWLAKKRGRITIPKWFIWYSSPVCDDEGNFNYVNHSLIIRVNKKGIYNYSHANKEDCRLNKKIIDNMKYTKIGKPDKRTFYYKWCHMHWPKLYN